MTTEQFYGPAETTAPQPLPRRRGGAARTVAWTLVGVLVVLALLFFGGGGWYFAGRIHEDALVVRHSEPAYGQSVVAVGDGTVTIADPADEQPLLDGDATWGLRWAAAEGGPVRGYGQIHGEGTGDDDVNRRLRVLQGAQPEVDDVVDLDRSAFPDDPELAVGAPVAEVAVESPLGSFSAWYAAADDSTWAILVHGKGEGRAEMLRMMRSTVAEGLPSLAITYRNDVGAPASGDHEFGYGATEWPELRAALRYARAQGATEVVLVGASMGGGFVASYLERFGPDGVAGVVLDSPMLDLSRTVAYGASQEPFPVLGSVPPALTWTAQRLVTVRFGVDWEEVDYLDSAQAAAVPTLVLHGDADLTVPIDTSERLAALDPKLVTLETFPGAGHVASWNSDPERYDDAVTSFLDRL